MDLAKLSITRPIFVTCVVVLSLLTGLLAMTKIGVDQYPDITIPVVTVTIPYRGAGPTEIETLVSKPVEDELSTIAGIKRLSSENRDGYGVVVAEFNLEVDIKYAEQQVRDHVGIAKAKLPTEVDEPTIQRIDPADQPILMIAVRADLPEAKLYDFADDRLKPMLEQVNNVGKVEINGGRKREIHVSLDRAKLKRAEISATQVVSRLSGAGQNIPGGKKNMGATETSFRTLGEFPKISDIRNLIVNFYSNEVPVRVGDLGTVDDDLEDEQTRTFYNGKPSLFIMAYKQTGSNTVAVADGLKKRIEQINAQIKDQPGNPKLEITRDGAHVVRINLDDVEESITIGIALAVIVVFLFLGNFRSTIITGLALPNSLIGAFILMWVAGYTINVMSLLALTLSVGLLVDDAIVVRENIFRHIEMGKDAVRAALDGTGEVRMAVIATTLTVVAVFGPLGFVSGVVGQFLKQFGLTVVFAMLISLFDALTIAPMLSAYFAGADHKKRHPIQQYSYGFILDGFSKFQDWLENIYEKLLHVIVRHPLITLILSVAVSVACFGTVKYLAKTFIPPQDSGEFTVTLDLPPGTSLDRMAEVALKADEAIRSNKEILGCTLIAGSNTGDPNQATFYVTLIPSKQRHSSTSQVKDKVREQLKPFAYANPLVKDFGIGGTQSPFTLNILGTDQKVLEQIGAEVRDKLKTNQALVGLDVNFRPGKPEFQVRPRKASTEQMGTSATLIGNEIKTLIEGQTPARFRENGLEYDVRVRLQESQRDIKAAFHETWVPNINNSLIRLDSVADPVDTTGPAKITRQDRMKYVQVSADIVPGKGLGDAMGDAERIMKNDIKLPTGYSYRFVGQGENFQELGQSMAIAMGAGIIFIYLVLASLYESFVTPFTIMLAMPLAMAGSFIALLITHESINLFSVIGLVMLLGVAVKNSILLVDYAHQAMEGGATRNESIIRAGKTRLRPILMTSFALIAGTLPIAMGLNEASKQRTSMGVAIIGGVISSTLLTLIVIPAVFSYIDRFRLWAQNFLGAIFVHDYKKHDH